MLDEFEDYAQPFPRDGANASLPDPVVLQRSWLQWLAFCIANWLFITPIMSLIYGVIVSDGLRLTLPATQTKLSKVPFLGIAEQYEGFHRIDLAIIVAVALYFIVTWLWMQIFLELLGHGSLARRRHCPKVVKYMLGFVSLLFIGVDSGLFYYGLSAKMASSWTEAPWIVLPAATLAFAAGAALIGWIHCDFRTAQSV